MIFHKKIVSIQWEGVEIEFLTKYTYSSGSRGGYFESPEPEEYNIHSLHSGNNLAVNCLGTVKDEVFELIENELYEAI